MKTHSDVDTERGASGRDAPRSRGGAAAQGVWPQVRQYLGMYVCIVCMMM